MDAGGEEMPEGFYEVEKIIGKMIGADGSIQYQVKWVGYTRPTMEPRTNLVESSAGVRELIQRFEASLLPSTGGAKKTKQPQTKGMKDTKPKKPVQLVEEVEEESEEGSNAEEDADKEWVMRKIIGKKAGTKKDNPLYLIEWEDVVHSNGRVESFEPTYEPLSNIIDRALVDEFEARAKKGRKTKGIKPSPTPITTTTESSTITPTDASTPSTVTNWTTLPSIGVDPSQSTIGMVEDEEELPTDSRVHDPTIGIIEDADETHEKDSSMNDVVMVGGDGVTVGDIGSSGAVGSGVVVEDTDATDDVIIIDSEPTKPTAESNSTPIPTVSLDKFEDMDDNPPLAPPMFEFHPSDEIEIIDAES